MPRVFISPIDEPESSSLFFQKTLSPQGLAVGQKLKYENTATNLTRMLWSLFLALSVASLGYVTQSKYLYLGIVLALYLYSLYLHRYHYHMLVDSVILEPINRFCSHADAYHMFTNMLNISSALSIAWMPEARSSWGGLIRLYHPNSGLFKLLVQLLLVSHFTYLALLFGIAHCLKKPIRDVKGASIGGYALTAFIICDCMYTSLPVWACGAVIAIIEALLQQYHFGRQKQEIDHRGHAWGVLCGLVLILLLKTSH